MLTSLALDGTIHRRSVFERKHYFYCDMPLGFQITQNDHPIMTHGAVTFPHEAQDEGHLCLGDIAVGDTAGDTGLPLRTAKTAVKTVRVKQLQIEQDSGKSIHDLDPFNSYVDLNRAGMALMEIVTEPDLYSSGEAASCVKVLQELVKHLGTCDGQMENGSMRCDVNVSVHPITPQGAACPDREDGGRVEVKNLNSIKNMVQAIDYEAARHVGILDRCGNSASAAVAVTEGGVAGAGVGADAAVEGNMVGVVLPETRQFNATLGTTTLLRTKEDAYDYRFFPEPDLLPLIVESEWVDVVRGEMPELPQAVRDRLVAEYGLSVYDTTVLTGVPGAAGYFERAVAVVARGGDASVEEDGCVESVDTVDRVGGVKGTAGADDAMVLYAKTTLNWITNELFGHQVSFQESFFDDRGEDGGEDGGEDATSTVYGEAVVQDDACHGAPCFVSSRQLGQLVRLVVVEKDISGNTAKGVLETMLEDGRKGVVPKRGPADIVRDEGLGQVSDADALRTICNDVLGRADVAGKIDQYAQGKVGLLGFFVGQVMKESQGKANPAAVSDIVRGLLPTPAEKRGGKKKGKKKGKKQSGGEEGDGGTRG